MKKLERIIKAVNNGDFHEASELIEICGIESYLPDDVKILLDSYEYYAYYHDLDDYFTNMDDYMEFTQSYVNNELEIITNNTDAMELISINYDKLIKEGNN